MVAITIDIEMRAAAQSLLDWWRDAGVDVTIDEQPHDWLTAVSPKRDDVTPSPAPGREPAAAAPPSVDRDPSSALPSSELPATLPEFTIWLASDASLLDDFPVRRRLAPEGSPKSSLMVVIDMPERGDSDVRRLLAGECGALFDKMVTAMGRTRADLYLATLAPARTATGRIDEAMAERLAPLLDHHIGLVQPQRLWLMGDAASRAVLAMDAREAAGKLHKVNHGGRTIDTIATVHPQVLIREPKLKARVWKDMQMLIEDQKS